MWVSDSQSIIKSRAYFQTEDWTRCLPGQILFTRRQRSGLLPSTRERRYVGYTPLAEAEERFCRILNIRIKLAIGRQKPLGFEREGVGINRL